MSCESAYTQLFVTLSVNAYNSRLRTDTYRLISQIAYKVNK